MHRKQTVVTETQSEDNRRQTLETMSAISFSSSSNSSSIPLYLVCFFSKPSTFIFTAYVITHALLLLPVCVLVLHHGLQQWKTTRSSSSSATVANHSDVFTYHMVTMELFSILGYLICCCGVYREDVTTVVVAFSLVTLNWFGEIYFHLLTSVERHLAVVHPVTYRSLRTERGARIRNTAIGCVWLLCFAGMWLIMMDDYVILDLCFLVLSLAVVLYCSLSVLRALIRPGPGEQGGTRGRVDQSKQRAFHTIALILLVLLLRLLCNLAWGVGKMGRHSVNCDVTGYELWLNLPSSLVLPLLFLHREAKLGCCQGNRK